MEAVKERVGHTPGPWWCEDPGRPFNVAVRQGISGFIVAHLPRPGEPVYQTMGGSAEANARLIAASPDLLAALEVVNQAIPLDYREHHVGTPELHVQLTLTVGECRQVIEALEKAKAK